MNLCYLQPSLLWNFDSIGNARRPHGLPPSETDQPHSFELTQFATLPDCQAASPVAQQAATTAGWQLSTPRTGSADHSGDSIGNTRRLRLRIPAI